MCHDEKETTATKETQRCRAMPHSLDDPTCSDALPNFQDHGAIGARQSLVAVMHKVIMCDFLMLSSLCSHTYWAHEGWNCELAGLLARC